MDPVFASSTGGDLAAVEERYRRLLVDRFDRLTFKGISRSGKAVSLPLEDVYVELKAVADVPDAADAYSADERRALLEAGARGTPDDDLRRQLDSLRVERWREESRRGETRLVRRSIEEAVAEPGRPGLVILGDPGSGKTTLLHYLALCAAKEGFREGAGEAPRPGATLRSAKGIARLPIFVPLAAYDDWLRRGHGALSLGEFLPFYYEKWSSFAGLGPLFRRALDEGRALVLLDGLDEVLDVGTRRHIAGQARALIQGETPHGNRFVVTSRIVGYREASLSGYLPEVSVLDFGTDEIAIFAHKWCEACEAWFAGGERTDTVLESAAKQEQDLLAEVRANPSVLRLAANPLLLTMLSLLRRQGGKLPDERVKLYERYIDMLLDNNWENVRNDGARTREPVRFDRNLATSYLIDLAHWLQRHKPSGTARRKDLQWALVEIALRTDGLDPIQASAKDRAQAHEKAELFLKDMRHFAGILAERGQDAFGFLHLTFQEYFAGRALARMDPEERWGILKENLHLPRWREPLLLCAGQLGLIEGRTKLVSDLGRRVLNAGSPHEDILHRDVLLVAAMAADGVGLERGLLDELTQRLTALSDSKVPAVRVKALTGLAKMALFGHEGAMTWLEERIRNRTRPWETGQALAGVIAADPCVGLRRSLCDWLDLSDHGMLQVALTTLRVAVASDKVVRRLILAKLDDANERVRQTAVGVLGPLVTRDGEVRRIILAKLDDASEMVRQTAIGALGALVTSDEEVRRLIVAKLDDADVDVRQRAVGVLGALVTSDEEVRRLTVAKLDDASEWVRHAAVGVLEALVGSDAEVRRLVVAKLDDADAAVRQTAVSALAALATSNEEVRRLVLAKLDDTDEHMRQTAVNALGALVASDEEVRRLVLAKLDDTIVGVRWAAIGALGPLAASNQEVRYLIHAKFDDTNGSVRQAAVGALRSVIASDGSVRRLVLAELEHKPCPVLHEMLDALTGLVSRDVNTRRLVVAKLDDADEDVRKAAVGALRALVASDEEVRRLIVAKLEDADEDVRQAAVGALGALVASDEEVRRLIVAKLDDADEDVRQAAVGALGALVGSDEEVRRLIVAKLDDADQWICSAAICASIALMANDKEVRHLILAKLDDASEWVRHAAVGALGALVASDEEVRRLILAKIDDTNGNVRRAAVGALGALVASDEEARRLVLARLDDTDESMRRAAVGALGALAASDEEVRRLVLAKLDDTDENMRRTAVIALNSIALDDPSVRGSILGKLEDPSFLVRAAAVSVLARLVDTNLDLRRRFLEWLGTVGHGGIHDAVRRRLAIAYAPLLAREPELLAQVVAMLRSPAWPARKGAACALLAMPGGPPPELLPVLRGLLEDQRGEESWPERLDTAALLINDRDASVSRRAIAVTVEALDYATQPWYALSFESSQVHMQAALILGTLEPSYRNDDIFVRLTRVLRDDGNEGVRDAAYQALLLLAVSPEIEHDIESLVASPVEPKQLVPLSPRPTMPPLPRSLVLHLSDLHFGTSENAVTWFSQLAEDLCDLECARLDAVILSGDIANASTPEEYAAARLFLEKLVSDLGLSRQQLILVPGNHDLNWGLAKKSYELKDREDCSGRLEEGHFIDIGNGAVRVRDDARYPRRFEPFVAFYGSVRGELYPLDPTEQAVLYPLPAQRLLVVGLNSAWELDHHFKARASINGPALARALDQIRAEPSYKDFLKIAVWHHPVHSSFEDRIKDHGFLERLANADFRFGLHGHIHKAENSLYRYDRSPAGRRLELVCAGTFGAPTRELVPGYPFQYQLLCFEGSTLTVETRRREEVHGAWKPDARWTTERSKDPAPRYQLTL